MSADMSESFRSPFHNCMSCVIKHSEHLSWDSLACERACWESESIFCLCLGFPEVSPTLHTSCQTACLLHLAPLRSAGNCWFFASVFLFMWQQDISQCVCVRTTFSVSMGTSTTRRLRVSELFLRVWWSLDVKQEWCSHQLTGIQIRKSDGFQTEPTHKPLSQQFI